MKIFVAKGFSGHPFLSRGGSRPPPDPPGNSDSDSVIGMDFPLTERDLSYYDAKTRAWKLATGKFIVSVGSSSRDIRFQTTFTIHGVIARIGSNTFSRKPFLTPRSHDAHH